jgi:glutamyl-tRNA synthetase
MNSDPAHVAHHLSYHLGTLEIDPTAGPDIIEVIKAQREKAKTLVDLAKVCEFYYRDPQEYDEKSAKKAFNAEAATVLAKLREALAVMNQWSREAIHATLQQVVEQLGVGFGKVGMPARLAITGGAPSPDLDLVMQLVGKEAALRRLDKAIEFINTTN